MRDSELIEAVTAGEVLMHGCSLDNLAAILADDVLRSGLRGHAGPRGVSLTTSLEIARQFCRTHEDEFSEVLSSWYDVTGGAAGAERHGAILVFDRTALGDVSLIPFVDISNYDEREERVLGDLVAGRLAGVIVDLEEVRWFETVVDTAFRSMNEPSDELLAALAGARDLFIPMQELADAGFARVA